jgi:hypothetical protein
MENSSSSNQVEKSHKRASGPRTKISSICDYLNCLPTFQDFDGLSTLIVRVRMSDERNEPDIRKSAHLALTMTQCASKSGFKPSRPVYQLSKHLFYSLTLFLTQFTKIVAGRPYLAPISCIRASNNEHDGQVILDENLISI